MQKRIWQLANGKFNNQPDSLRFSVPEVVIKTAEGSDFSGEFSISTVSHEKMKGFISAEDPRIEVVTNTFADADTRIRYIFHARGFSAGDTLNGSFVFTTDSGVFELPYKVEILSFFAETSIGNIYNLSDFIRLYQQAPKEAFKLFYSDSFVQLLTEEKDGLYYKGFSLSPMNFANIEEFLVAVKAKARTEFSVSVEGLQDNPAEDTRCHLIINKEKWGYIDIDVESDHKAIRFDKRKITDDDFIGSTARIPFFVLKNKLHSGRNLVKITVTGPFDTKEQVIVINGAELSEREKVTLEIQKSLASMTSEYVSYRLRQKVTGDWALSTTTQLEHLFSLDPENAWYPLMKAQVFIANHQKQEAMWILRDYRHEKLSSDSGLRAYYLYLSTLIEKEPSFVAKLTEEIENLFRECPDDARIFWMLLFLRQDYIRDPGFKFRSIRHWIENGYASPFFYVEAYILLWQNPSLITSLDDFSMGLLEWSYRHGALTLDLIIQAQNLLAAEKHFSERVFKFFTRAYEKFPDEVLLRSVCSYLLGFGIRGKVYRDWYEAGIDAGLSLFGLYEAFLESLDPGEITALPSTLTMYYGFDDSLPPSLRSILYANVIMGRKEDESAYNQYERDMELFAIDSIKQGRIDDNYAVIYEDLMRKGLISDSLARDLAPLMLTYRLAVPDSSVVRAYIYENAVKLPQIVGLIRNNLYFSLCSKEKVVILEDKACHRYASEGSEPENMLAWGDMLKKLSALSRESLPYAIWYLTYNTDISSLVREDAAFFELILRNESLEERFRGEIFSRYLRFMNFFHIEDGIDRLFSKGINLSALDNADRSYVIDQMVDWHYYDQAYEGVLKFGLSGISKSKQLMLISYEIDLADGEFDENLLSFTEQCFDAGVYNNELLSYLCTYYLGDVSKMVKIFEEASAFEVSTWDLAERIITHSLFAGIKPESILNVFEAYLNGHAASANVEAFLSFYSNEYVLDRDPYNERFLEMLYSFSDQSLNEVCKIALLKGLVEKKELSDREALLVDELLDEFLARGIYFEFYKQMPQEMLDKYHLYDKCYVEYKGTPRSRIYIHYMQDGAMTTEEMQEMYGGIYVKQFVLFFGEEKEYYITLASEDGEEAVESNKIHSREMIGRDIVNRYDYLNHMAMDLTLENRADLANDIKQYSGLDLATLRLFTLRN